MNHDEFMKEYERIMKNERGAKIASATFTENQSGNLFEYRDNSIFTLITFSLKNIEPFIPYTINLSVRDKDDKEVWQGTPPPFSYNADIKEDTEIPITLNLDFRAKKLEKFKVLAVLVRVVEGLPTPIPSGIVQDTVELELNTEAKNGGN